MKIELKNIKYAAFASEETHCFEATVYIDGKKSFGVSNDGHGGCDSYYPVKGGVDHPHNRLAEVDAILGLEEIPVSWDKDITINNSLEIVVGDLMNEWLQEKEIKRILKRVCYTKKGAKKGEIYQLSAKFKPTAQTFDQLKKVAWWTPDCVLLNELPLAEVKQYL